MMIVRSEKEIARVKKERTRKTKKKNQQSLLISRVKEIHTGLLFLVIQSAI